MFTLTPLISLAIPVADKRIGGKQSETYEVQTVSVCSVLTVLRTVLCTAHTGSSASARAGRLL